MPKKDQELVKNKQKVEVHTPDVSVSSDVRENKSFRVSTARKREELEQRQQERAAQKKLKHKKSISNIVDQPEYRRLTQEELLQEAKITEKINIASLDAYQKLELEKKKKSLVKNVFKGPMIRYQSVAMPLVRDQDEIDNGIENNEGFLKQSRNFISFSDEHTLREIFPRTKPKAPDVQQKVCPITGLVAKYFDPITQTPFANLYAFKALRALHAAKNTTDN